MNSCPAEPVIDRESFGCLASLQNKAELLDDSSYVETRDLRCIVEEQLTGALEFISKIHRIGLRLYH